MSDVATSDLLISAWVILFISLQLDLLLLA